MPQEEILIQEDSVISFISRIATIHSQSASRIVWHNHQHTEIILVVDGATGYEFISGNKIHLRGGQFLVIPPNLLHRGIDNVRSPARLCGIMIQPERIISETRLPLPSQDHLKLHAAFQITAAQMGTMNPWLHSLTRSLPNLIRAVNDQQSFAISNMNLRLLEIVVEVAKQMAEGSNRSSRRIVDEATGFMKTHLYGDRSIDDVVSHVNCSRATLFKTFKESTGMSPNDYWQRIRIETAQLKLKQSRESITQIALDCGFTTSQYFSSVFKKYTGISPKQYRLSAMSAEQTARFD